MTTVKRIGRPPLTEGPSVIYVLIFRHDDFFVRCIARIIKSIGPGMEALTSSSLPTIAPAGARGKAGRYAFL